MTENNQVMSGKPSQTPIPTRKGGSKTQPPEKLETKQSPLVKSEEKILRNFQSEGETPKSYSSYMLKSSKRQKTKLGSPPPLIDLATGEMEPPQESIINSETKLSGINLNHPLTCETKLTNTPETKTKENDPGYHWEEHFRLWDEIDRLEIQRQEAEKKKQLKEQEKLQQPGGRMHLITALRKDTKEAGTTENSSKDEVELIYESQLPNAANLTLKENFGTPQSFFPNNNPEIREIAAKGHEVINLNLSPLASSLTNQSGPSKPRNNPSPERTTKITQNTNSEPKTRDLTNLLDNHWWKNNSWTEDESEKEYIPPMPYPGMENTPLNVQKFLWEEDISECLSMSSLRRNDPPLPILATQSSTPPMSPESSSEDSIGISIASPPESPSRIAERLSTFIDDLNCSFDLWEQIEEIVNMENEGEENIESSLEQWNEATETALEWYFDTHLPSESEESFYSESIEDEKTSSSSRQSSPEPCNNRLNAIHSSGEEHVERTSLWDSDYSDLPELIKDHPGNWPGEGGIKKKKTK